jgi:hypothetical protein
VLPQYVEEFEFRVDEDSNGELALFLWVLLKDSAPASAWTNQSLNRLSDKLRRAYDRHAVASDPRWIYFYFRSVSEHEALGGSDG